MDVRRQVPRTDAVLADPALASALQRLDRTVVKAAVVAAQREVRAGRIAPEDTAAEAARLLPASAASLRPVLNATGVVLHTNLGRAPLAPAAVQAVVDAAGYTDVEYDLGTGRRARRGRQVLDVLRAAAPAAEDVLLVNNGAAALLLAATVLAAGREMLISRGEMVEIGDGFRLPDLLVSTGARLREVGTTNRTTVDDYRAALTPETGCVLKIHPSNFRISGFTAEAGLAELAGLTDSSGFDVPVVADLGSGLLRRHPLLPDEPDADTALRAGADLVTGSGDKLLGGPQAGLLLGRKDLVERCRRSPIARAFRVDKLTLAAFEATLLAASTPTDDALTADPEHLRARAEKIVAELPDADVVKAAGAVGGGGAPGLALAGWAVAVDERFAEPLRRGNPPVVGRVEDGRCLLDLRCVPAERDADLLVALRAVSGL
jgi:L-seryl-tRNA(Ser) seleniumtransferase